MRFRHESLAVPFYVRQGRRVDECSRTRHPSWTYFVCLRLFRSAVSNKSLFEAKDDARRRAAAAEKAKEAAVEEAVSRVQLQVEESMSENFRYSRMS